MLKTLERYVANELRRYIDANDCNDLFHSPYRPRHSTETALVRIHEDLTQTIDVWYAVLLVMLDLSGVFDTLDHTILLRRICDLGLSHTVIAWFTSYLGGRRNAVKIRQSTSVRRTTKQGHILFNLYCLPIADIFKRHNLRYHLYTDDTQLYAECSPSQHRDALLCIDECVRELIQWLANNTLLLNKDTTEAMTFRSSSVRSPTVGSVIGVCGATIPLKMVVRDVGA